MPDRDDWHARLIVRASSLGEAGRPALINRETAELLLKMHTFVEWSRDEYASRLPPEIVPRKTLQIQSLVQDIAHMVESKGLATK